MNTPEAIHEANAGKRWDSNTREWVADDLVAESLRLAETTDEAFLEGAQARGRNGRAAGWKTSSTTPPRRATRTVVPETHKVSSPPSSTTCSVCTRRVLSRRSSARTTSPREKRTRTRIRTTRRRVKSSSAWARRTRCCRTRLCARSTTAGAGGSGRARVCGRLRVLRRHLRQRPDGGPGPAHSWRGFRRLKPLAAASDRYVGVRGTPPGGWRSNWRRFSTVSTRVTRRRSKRGRGAPARRARERVVRRADAQADRVATAECPGAPQRTPGGWAPGPTSAATAARLEQMRGRVHSQVSAAQAGWRATPLVQDGRGGDAMEEKGGRREGTVWGLLDRRLSRRRRPKRRRKKKNGDDARRTTVPLRARRRRGSREASARGHAPCRWRRCGTPAALDIERTIRSDEVLKVLTRRSTRKRAARALSWTR